MATKIRLRRMGARNNPFYRLVVADSRFATTGRYLEVLGWYDPKKADNNYSVNVDRVDYWLGAGSQMSDTAKSLIKKARMGGGVAPGSAPNAKKVDTQSLMEEVPQQSDSPAEPLAVEETADVSIDVSDEVEETKAEAPEKQES